MADKYCRKCGTELSPADKRCPGCGAKIRGAGGLIAALIAVVVIGAGLFASWHFDTWPVNLLPGTGCTSAKVAHYKAQISPLTSRWKAAFDLAASSPKITLAGPVGQLQQIRTEYAAIKPPECLEQAHRYALAGMDKGIEGFLAFMRGESEQGVGNLLELCGFYFGEATDAIKEVSAQYP